MPRAPNNVVENNFINGLITEATSLNFPQNACTDTDNCVFHPKGSVFRRYGLEFEQGYTTKLIDRQGKASTTYYWRNAAGQANKDFLVLQVSGILYFYAVGSDAVSAGAYTQIIDFSTFASGSSSIVGDDPCQFASGQGYLFVSHPHTEPFFVSYDSSSDSFTPVTIGVFVRDTKGVDDGFGVIPNTRPTTLTDLHKYNLMNQGWYPQGNDYVTLWKSGTTTGIQGGGAGYVAAIAAPNNTAGQPTYPSNCDVWWLYRAPTGGIDFRLVGSYDRGASPAPKGYCIYNAWNIDRTLNVPNTTVETSGIERPSCISFYAGRVWYAGTSAQGYANRLYYSQTAKGPNYFGKCHQLNDPTNEFLFDILATDGGTIDILDCGSIVKLVPMNSMLLIFATNGVWVISGNQGIGFTPTDFAVRKISAIPALTASSFIDVDGAPYWWNNDGIYTVSIANPQTGAVEVSSISERTIKAFFADIPTENKKYVRGAYNPLTRQVQWLYRYRTIDSAVDRYEFDRALTYNSISKAFYPWTFPHQGVKVLGIQALSCQGTKLINEPTRGTDGSISMDARGEPVFSRTQSTSLSAFVFKYLVAYLDGTQYRLTFAESYDTSYLDFKTFDGVGNDFTSYFVTGYKLDGQASAKFQQTYVTIYGSNLDQCKLKMQGIWDFATSMTMNRNTAWQTLDFDHTRKDLYQAKKLKIRGMGRALQLRFISVPGKGFDLSGWARYESISKTP